MPAESSPDRLLKGAAMKPQQKKAPAPTRRWTARKRNRKRFRWQSNCLRARGGERQKCWS